MYEEPGSNQCQAAVLPVESVMVGVEREVVQVEESGDKNILNFKHLLYYNKLKRCLFTLKSI